MCYNEIVVKPCKITVSAKSPSRNDNFTSQGTAEISASGIKFSYFIEGEGCALLYSQGKVTHIRGEKEDIRMDFEENKSTRCNLAFGGFTGGFGIHTHKLRAVSGAGGVRIALEYEGGGETTNLVFTAVYI